MSEWPEHDKLRAVAEQTQAIGEFLDWIAAERGGHLMAWNEWAEQVQQACEHFSQSNADRCRKCAGALTYTETVHYKQMLPLSGSVQDWLAEWAGVDRRKLEAEKRAMLASLR